MCDAPSKYAAQTARAALITAQKHTAQNLVNAQVLGSSGPVIAADCDLGTLQALSVVSNAAAVACRAAAALQVMYQRCCDDKALVDSASQPMLSGHADPHVAVVAALEAVQLLQEHMSNSGKAQTSHDQECTQALAQQEKVLREAEAKLQEVEEKEAAATAQTTAKTTTHVQSLKAFGAGLKTWLAAMSTRSGNTFSKQYRPYRPVSRPQHNRRSRPSANRVALPAGTYYSMAKGLINLRAAREQQQYYTQLQYLGYWESPQERASTAEERLDTLYSLMRQRVAPYHLALSDYELVLTGLHSLPWLERTRADVQQSELVELKLLEQQIAQHEQNTAMLSGRKRQAAVVAMSRTARMHLLLAHSRHIVASGNLASSSSSMLRGPSTSASQAHSASSCLQDVDSTSFDGMLCEVLRSGISAHHMKMREKQAAAASSAEDLKVLQMLMTQTRSKDTRRSTVPACSVKQ